MQLCKIEIYNQKFQEKFLEKKKENKWGMPLQQGTYLDKQGSSTGESLHVGLGTSKVCLLTIMSTDEVKTKWLGPENDTWIEVFISCVKR